MYQSYFGLAEAPFSIAPDPRYLYMSQRHQEALAHLLYGLGGEGGFLLLTGEVGTGKTTVCRCLLERIPDSCDLAYIFNPRLTEEELLSTICVEFDIDYPPGNQSIKVFIDAINAYLLEAHARGRNTVLIIDEAQNLSVEVLEQLRLLTNLETNQRKLLQIILLGQPELAVMLERTELRQLAQRIVARYHLGPLSKAEVAAYVSHRLEISGAKHSLFPASLMGQLHRLSGGVPRVINLLCDRALLGTYVLGRDRVNRAILGQAAREVFPRPSGPRRSVSPFVVGGLILLASGAALTTLYLRGDRLGPAPQTQGSASIKAAAPVLPVAPVVAAAEAHPPSAGEALPAEALAWPTQQLRSQSRTLAYAALLRAWGVEPAGANPCQQAETLGLRCRTARGSLDEIRQVNRPAVLYLRDGQGVGFHATLLALDQQSARFAVGGETRTVAFDALASQWSGHYTVLWRVPPQVPGNLRPGERSPAVQWLDRQLALAKGGEVAKDAVFDEALALRLRQFQLAQGLIPDSALGPQTLMRLSALGDQTAPTLRREQKEK